ncbi:hypothetical protein F5883DRAFT_236451 [Diaporthe sp. PMI_573]|nr:hypothetical protein F5883DRAFT_236451 [Diaporthaceae sp. PMI_573]
MIPSKLLRGVLQRFTTTNDVSGMRMLAVKRSPRDTQFLLDNCANALVLNQLGLDGEPFFADPSFKELWDQTINVQPFHLENEEYGSRWSFATRYLLSVMLGLENKSLNEKKPCQVLKDSVTTLLHFFGHNSFQGARLGENREPVLFEEERDRDLYYHVSFEVFYMLHILTGAVQKRKDERSNQNHGDKLAEILRCVKEISSNSKITAWSRAHGSGSRHGAALVMKENMPSNRNIDTSNICMIEEEEWIHNFPEFLSASTIHRDEGCDDSVGADSDSETSVASDSETTWSADNETTQDTVIADAKKQKLYGQPRTVETKPWLDAPYESYGHDELKYILRKPRTARDAKKRFIWIRQADRNKPARQICQTVHSSADEKRAISRFFSRHVRHENLYHEYTHPLP